MILILTLILFLDKLVVVVLVVYTDWLVDLGRVVLLVAFAVALVAKLVG